MNHIKAIDCWNLKENIEFYAVRNYQGEKIEFIDKILELLQNQYQDTEVNNPTFDILAYESLINKISKYKKDIAELLAEYNWEFQVPNGLIFDWCKIEYRNQSSDNTPINSVLIWYNLSSYNLSDYIRIRYKDNSYISIGMYNRFYIESADMEVEDIKHVRIGHIQDIEATHKGTGMGSKLLNMAYRIIEHNGCDLITWGTNTSNKRLVNHKKKNGFIISPERPLTFKILTSKWQEYINSSHYYSSFK